MFPTSMTPRLSRFNIGPPYPAFGGTVVVAEWDPHWNLPVQAAAANQQHPIGKVDFGASPKVLDRLLLAYSVEKLRLNK